MAVRFVLGRAGSGKTHLCVRAVADAQRQSMGDRLLLLVPEQASFQMERALAAASPVGGYLRTEVLGFSRLAERVFEEVGPAPVVLSRGARTLALRAILGATPALAAPFGRAANTPGFLRQIEALIQELLQEGVHPQQLLRVADERGDAGGALRSVGRIYESYLEWIGQRRIDPAQRLAALRDHMFRVPWLGSARIWVDGFAGFTGEELATLLALARGCRELWITLLLDPAASLSAAARADAAPRLFDRTERTYQLLRRELAASHVEIGPSVMLSPPPPRFARAAALVALEAELAGDDALRGPAAALGREVRIVECDSPRDELRIAARWIRRMIAGSPESVHLRDFAVICRDLEPIAPLVSEVFEEYELPFFLDRRRPVRSHALSRFVEALLDAIERDFPPDVISRLPATGLLPMDRESAELLDDYVLRNDVHGWAAWRLPWAGAPDVLNFHRGRFAAAIGVLAETGRAGRPMSGGKWVRALHAALDALGIAKRIDAWTQDAAVAGDWEVAETHRLAWDALVGLLEDTDEILGDRSLELTEFAALLRSSLADLSLGMAPPTLDQVLISSIERSRHPEIRFAWVIGLNDGVFPQRPTDQLVLTEDDRAALQRVGATSLRRRDDQLLGERLLAYIAFTRPSERLVLSYSRTADDGSPQFPSIFVRDLLERFPATLVERPSDAPPASLPELARRVLARSRELGPTGRWWTAKLLDRVAPRFERQRFARLSEMLAGVRYENRPGPIAPPPPPSDDVAWRGSPSELETWLQCPFQWFARRVMRLRAERGPTPMAQRLGQTAHELLAETTRAAIADPRDVRKLSNDDWHKLLDEVVTKVLRGGTALRAVRPRERAQVMLLARRVRDVLDAHVERMRVGTFAPAACEQSFGAADDEASWSAARILLERGAAELIGRIDRIDAAPAAGGALHLVYDYKSGTRSFRGPFFIGPPLQLLLYLHALAQRGHKAAGVLVAPLHVNSYALQRGRDESDASARKMALYKPRGVLNEDAAAALDPELADGEASRVAALRKTKAGAWYKNGDVRCAQRLQAHVDVAVATARLAIDGITRGRIDVEPLLIGRRLACNDCAFRAVCRYEPLLNRSRPAETSLPLLPKPEPNAKDAT